MKRINSRLIGYGLLALISALPVTFAQGQRQVRTLSRVPPPGQHPRVFFSKSDLPDIKQRLESEGFGADFKAKILDRVIPQVRNQVKSFAVLNLKNPTDEQLLEYVKANESRNINWGMAALYSVLYDDVELRKLMCKSTENYARLLLASRERRVGGDLKGRTGIELGKNFNFWDNDSFGVGVSWTLGGAGYALCYDVLYNYMSKEQRNVVRQAIAAGAKGRRPYGSGMHKGYAASNHYGYHGDLAVMLCAIEGEPGYDAQTFKTIKQVLLDYWEVGFTPQGACHEDGYGPNLGLRAGSRGLLALARRGDNIFKTEKYQNLIDWTITDHEPYPGGVYVGGASGANYRELYPTSIIMMRYMYPSDPAANMAFRHMVGDEYTRSYKWQGWLDYMLYGDSWEGPESRTDHWKETTLDLGVFYPQRGKMIARSDWSNDALQFHLDSRPDAWMIGHDKSDRGNFAMSALGRMWAFTGDFRQWNNSTENSHIHIDGKGQAYKAPAAWFTWYNHSSKATVGCVDLKYAYDWEWTPPWPKVDKEYGPEWTEETSSPFDLGWHKAANYSWLPKSLFGSESGYSHLNGLRKRPYNTVSKAWRSGALIRGEQPYVLIADELQKDDGELHEYEWLMQLPTDLDIVVNAGRDIVLGSEDDLDENPRRLLVRVLRADAEEGITPPMIEGEINEYIAAESSNQAPYEGKSLSLRVNSKDPHFRIMLYPFRQGDAIPKTQLDGETLKVTWPKGKDTVEFVAHATKGINIVVR